MKKYFKWGPRPSAVLPLALTLEGAMTMDQVMGVSWPTTYLVFGQEENRTGRLHATWLNSLDDLVQVGGTCFEEVQRMGLKSFFSRVDEASERLLCTSANNVEEPLESLSDDELSRQFESFRSVYVDWWRYNYVIEPLEHFAEIQSEKDLGDKAAISKLAKPTTHTMDSEVSSGLHALARRLLRDDRTANALVSGDVRILAERIEREEDLCDEFKRFQKNYYWIDNNYSSTKTLTLDQILRKVLDYVESSGHEGSPLAPNGIHEDMRERRRALAIANSPSSTEASRLLALWDRMPKFKDDRKKLNLQANHIVDRFALEISRRRHMMVVDTRNLLPHEVSPAIQGLAGLRLRERREALVVIWPHGASKSRCLYPEDLDALAYAGIGQTTVSQASALEERPPIVGDGNSCGTTKGVAYYCPDIDDARMRMPMDRKSILVTTMTSPEWFPVMSRVCGLVTREGGQASHASLLCGQLQIPLILGAEESGPFLDESVVSLDSNKGELEILKPSAALLAQGT